MKPMKFPLILLALPLALSGCVEPDPAEQTLVVEGFIADGGYPTVCLMQTVDPTQQGASLADMVVRWGVVRISDGERTVMLTGGPDRNYFPPYTYTTYEMQGEVGRTYTLTAEYDGRQVTAVTRIPEPVAIDSVTAQPDGRDGSERRLDLWLTAKSDGPEYFRVMTRVRGVHTQLLPGFMGAGESGGADGLVKIPVNRPRTSRDTVDYRTSFLPGEQIEVALCTMDRDAYLFWRDYDNAVAFGGSQFLVPSSPLRGNIRGGYGYFHGYGMTRRILTVE